MFIVGCSTHNTKSCSLLRAESHLYIVILTVGGPLQVKGHESVVDGIAHGGLDGPTARGVMVIAVGVVQRLDEALAWLGYDDTLACYIKKKK